jgi:SAM-dependent methyltransferase
MSGASASSRLATTTLARPGRVLAATESTPVQALSFRSKYNITAALLAGRTGTLLDVGARDRALERHLRGGRLAYHSADRSGEQDHTLDLEHALSLGDGSFDVVVALDCLEHVDRLHAALHELIRVSRAATVVALPNLACWQHRLSFLWRGRLATDKYDLTSSPPDDRHRWLTVLPQTDDFVRANVPAATHRLTHIVHETTGGPAARIASFVMLCAGLPLQRALVARSIYLIEAVRP